MQKIPKKARIIIGVLVGIAIIVGIITIINSYRLPQDELRKLYTVLLILLAIIGIGMYLHYRPDIIEKFANYFVRKQYYDEDFDEDYYDDEYDEYLEEYSDQIIQYPFPKSTDNSETSEEDDEDIFDDFSEED